VGEFAGVVEHRRRALAAVEREEDVVVHGSLSDTTGATG
jgi:hypothetical protein